MIKNFFKKTKDYTQKDLSVALLSAHFKEIELNEMLACELDINWKNDEGEGYLHLCAKKKLQLSLEWLIKNKIDIRQENANKETAIFYAVLSNNLPIVRFLLEQGLDLNVANKYGRRPLQEAIISNNTKVIDFIIENIKDINHVDIHKKNIVFDVIANGDTNLISKIISLEGLNLNQIDKLGNTPLLQKTIIDNPAFSIALLAAGADPRIENSKGKNFLYYITHKGIESIDVLNKVLSKGYDLNDFNMKNDQTLLMCLVTSYAKEEISDRKNSLLKMIVELIAKGMDLNSKDSNGDNILFYTVKNRDIQTTHYILEQGNVDINELNNSGETVLSLSIIHGSDNIDMVVTLLKFKANPNIKNAEGKTVVETLITKTVKEDPKKANYLFVLNSVLENSQTDLTSFNSDGEPHFFEVITHKRFNLLKLFRKYGFDLNQVDEKGNNIIHSVIHKFTDDKGFNKKDLAEILMFLITNGVDINTQDSSGRTALQIALVEDWIDIIKFLLDAKANSGLVDVRGRSAAHCCVWNNNVKNFKILHSYDREVINISDEYGILPINYAAFMGHKDLVVNMIESGSFVNNTNTKNKDVVKSLSTHSENLDKLVCPGDKALIRRNISLLVNNMKEEFSLS